MATEIATHPQQVPPELWTHFAGLSFSRKSMLVAGESPVTVSSASPQSDVEAALRAAESWMDPAPETTLIRALRNLYLSTARRKEDADDMTVVAGIYSASLRDYPGDIALDCVKAWRGTFFPALAELREKIELDPRLRDRTHKIRALKDYLSNPPSPKREITQADREAMSAKASRLKQELAGSAPSTEGDRV